MDLGSTYQRVLIALGVISTVLLGVFFYRELFPEYRIYQQDFIALEKLRSRLTGEAPAPFQEGVKQIVIERSDKGPAIIDRCTSCHVALEIEAYSKTRLKKDLNGHFVTDSAGVPVQEENPDYIWNKLDKASAYLKTAKVGEHTYNVQKVLSMHPLMGRETRPFEYHPVDVYGCTSCHGGNGRGLVTDRAHGPIFDGEYETENRGYVPQFLEKDPVNDPKFAYVFNAKPGHRLLFQTSPLYVGALMQAKCVQCHLSTPDAMQQAVNSAHFKIQTDLDLLTKDYQRGQRLFISQGCYACHRIAGLSRGGVGPELTHEGDSYPWFIKESIVWPQADLKTSTMPNLRLDHDELEALTTYLLGQSEKNRAVSDTERKIRLQQWESGKKQGFEQPVGKEAMQDLHYGMTVFATEGCASCHRLKGYESDVGFTQGDSEWFESLFPETILGSQIVKVLEEHAADVDARISDGVRKGSLLEKMEEENPGLIEGFYSNFKFALRAKNSEVWKARVRRVLKMYIQVYGLGRLICPRLNWSGVFRSDQWLMEHFKNPSALVPRSIMPAFPFDDSKFYALTYMLDKLGEKNVQKEREEVQLKGFDPAAAYHTHCAACHGNHLLGNGPVAEWIYPIPKNLASAEFLRSLTPERAIDSITHGVKGTPMPPWGEVGDAGKSKPVFTKEEIKQLVDWLYATLPGQSALPQDVPKWHYGIENVIHDLKAIGYQGDYKGGYQGDDIFEAHPNPPGYADKESYYIKKEFYTEKNIEAGRHFFVENCAPCHGKEGDGTGARSEAMGDAKPRMLSNPDWIHSKDDLRLIRSIKYGVPGTAMTPWGDLTNALQRLQLVLFIRTLSKEQKETKL